MTLQLSRRISLLLQYAWPVIEEAHFTASRIVVEAADHDFSVESQSHAKVTMARLVARSFMMNYDASGQFRGINIAAAIDIFREEFVFRTLLRSTACAANVR